MHRWCPWWCGRGRETAPEGTDQEANCNFEVLGEKNALYLGSFYLPPHENVVRILQILVVKIIRVERLCILVEGLELALHIKTRWRWISLQLCTADTLLRLIWLTQCFRSTSSSASHFRVRNGRFLLMISPAKNVVSVGYSCKKQV